MKITQCFTSTFDFYKKSPDLNYHRAEFKSSKISLFFTLVLIALTIGMNYLNLSNLWISQNQLTKVSSAQILQNQTLTPFMVGLFIQGQCQEYPNLSQFYYLYYPKLCTYYPKVECSSGITNQFIANEDQCYICFQVDVLDVQNFWNQAFRVEFHAYQNITFHADQIIYTLIIEHQGYNETSNKILSQMNYQIVPNIVTESFTPILCSAYELSIDNSLFDWSKTQKVSFLTNCKMADWESKTTAGVVVNQIESISYQRLKISTILSDIVSFSFLTVIITFLVTNYNKTMMNFELSQEIIKNSTLQNTQFNYFMFLWLKILKNDFIRSIIKKYNWFQKSLEIFYCLRKTNQQLSVQNILTSLNVKIEQRGVVQQIKQSKNINKSEDNQKYPVNYFLEKIKEPEDNKNCVILKSNPNKKFKESFLVRVIKNFDMFSSPIEFEEQEIWSTSCFSILLTLITIIVILLLAYYSSFLSTFTSTNQSQFMIVKQSNFVNFTAQNLKIYIVVMDESISAPGIPYLKYKEKIGIKVTLKNQTVSPIQFQIDCPLPEGFIFPYSKTVQYCIHTNFSLTSTFLSSDYLNISIYPLSPVSQKLRFMIIQNYYTFQGGQGIMKWAKMGYDIPNFVQTTQQGIYTQNIWITKGVQYDVTLFKTTQTDNAIFIKNIFQKSMPVDEQGSMLRLDILFRLSSEEYQLQNRSQQIFDLIINALGISYLSFLFITKTLTTYFNKQKSLRSMSRNLKLLDSQNDLEIFYQCLFGSRKIEVQDQENNKKTTKIRQIEYNILNMSNILMMILKLEYTYPRQITYMKQEANEADLQSDQDQHEN